MEQILKKLVEDRKPTVKKYSGQIYKPSTMPGVDRHTSTRVVEQNRKIKQNMHKTLQTKVINNKSYAYGTSPLVNQPPQMSGAIFSEYLKTTGVLPNAKESELQANL